MVNSSFQIALQKCAYRPDILAESLQRCAPILGIDKSFNGAKVLLKPNLLSVTASPLACTHGQVIAAAAAWFIDHGARVMIGDSPAFGSVRSIMAKFGILSALDTLSVEVIDFSKKKKVRLANGISLYLAAEALDCDFFVNLPKLKAHDQMYITAAVKNIFGIVVGSQKAMLHMRCGGSHREFAEILLQLPALLPESVSIVDGIEAMHIAGPMSGRKLALGCLAAARNPMALDTALLNLLELDERLSPLWACARQQGNPGCDRNKLEYPLASPGEFARSGFMAPLSLSPIRFNPLRFVASSLKRLRLAISGRRTG